MPKPRKSAKVHSLQGSWKHDPQRRRSDVEATGEVDPPPDWLTEHERACYEKIVENAPNGVLHRSDSFFVQQLASLMAQHRHDKANFGAARMSLLRQMLREAGVTPASRAYVDGAPPVSKNDPYAKFRVKSVGEPFAESLEDD